MRSQWQPLRGSVEQGYEERIWQVLLQRQRSSVRRDVAWRRSSMWWNGGRVSWDGSRRYALSDSIGKYKLSCFAIFIFDAFMVATKASSVLVNWCYGTLTSVSTWMGDHQWRPGVVNLGPFVSVDFKLWLVIDEKYHYGHLCTFDSKLSSCYTLG